jgi:hypothetical protein
MKTYELWKGETLIAYIHERPHYCDRGRYHANVQVPIWQSEADPWPRYYFGFDVAKSELLAYLGAKKVDVTSAEWKELEYKND